jgi:drug/metabolite transporter (DMT)-like permease
MAAYSIEVLPEAKWLMNSGIIAAVVLIATTAGISLGVDIVTRFDNVSVGSLLMYRGLLGILVLGLWKRPRLGELWPNKPGLAIIRLIFGGLTFAGWFGAITYLSAPVTAALLLVDCVLLRLIKACRMNWKISIAEIAVFFCLTVYVSAVWAASRQASEDLVVGVILVAVAVVARAASLHVWERSCELGEKPVLRILIPLLGSTLVGIALCRGAPSLLPPDAAPVILLTAALGVLAYSSADVVVFLFGAFRTRLVELLAVPILAGAEMYAVGYAGSSSVFMALFALTAATLWALWTPLTNVQAVGVGGSEQVPEAQPPRSIGNQWS